MIRLRGTDSAALIKASIHSRKFDAFEEKLVIWTLTDTGLRVSEFAILKKR